MLSDSRGRARPSSGTGASIGDWGEFGGGKGGGGGGRGGDADSSADRSCEISLSGVDSSGGGSEFYGGGSDVCSTGRWGEWTTICKTRRTAETVELPRAVDRGGVAPLGLRYRVGARRREEGMKAAFR